MAADAFAPDRSVEESFVASAVVSGRCATYRTRWGTSMVDKKRCRFLIDDETSGRLEAMRARTGLSIAEQVRRALQFWIESDEGRFPPRGPRSIVVKRRRTRRKTPPPGG